MGVALVAAAEAAGGDDDTVTLPTDVDATLRLEYRGGGADAGSPPTHGRVVERRVEVRVVPSVGVASVRALDVVPPPPSTSAPPSPAACLAVRVTHAGPVGDATPWTVWLAAAADPGDGKAWGRAQAARTDRGAPLPLRGAVTVVGVVPPLASVPAGDADAAATAAGGRSRPVLAAR